MSSEKKYTRTEKLQGGFMPIRISRPETSTATFIVGIEQKVEEMRRLGELHPNLRGLSAQIEVVKVKSAE